VTIDIISIEYFSTRFNNRNEKTNSDSNHTFLKNVWFISIRDKTF